MAYSNKFNQILGSVVGSKPYNPLVDRVSPHQSNNFLYESAFGGGMHLGGLNGGGISPFPVSGYNIYPHQQYNLKVGGGNQEQGSEYGHPPPYTGSSTNTGSGYGVPRFQGAKNKIKGTALSALTLLAFLYFLNLLQTCLRDQMNTMNPTVLVMTAGSREGVSQIDRVGTVDTELEPEPKYDVENIKSRPIEETKKVEIQWNRLEPQTSISTPKLQNLFLESQSWG